MGDPRIPVANTGIRRKIDEAKGLFSHFSARTGCPERAKDLDPRTAELLTLWL
jgi:hypothetical protein